MTGWGAQPSISSTTTPSWPARFEQARVELVRVLGELIVTAHHIGSTAVPGLLAKATIDIAAVVRSVDGFIDRVAAVEQLGYEYRPTAKFHDEHLFLRRIEADERTHHLHVVSETCEDLRDWLDLRDYLRQNRDAAERYAETKRAVADRYYTDRPAYVDGKSPIIGQLLAEARGVGDRIGRQPPASG